jgi:hypothetical protein
MIFYVAAGFNLRRETGLVMNKIVNPEQNCRVLQAPAGRMRNSFQPERYLNPCKLSSEETVKAWSDLRFFIFIE